MTFEFRKVFTKTTRRFDAGDVVPGCVAHCNRNRFLAWIEKVNAENAAGKIPYRVVPGAFDET